jgi:hypothetical protein
MPHPNPPSRLLTRCERGPRGSRPVLHLAYPPSAQSTLEITLAPGITCEVLLAPRYTLFLLLVADAWNQDEGQIETQRGFRTKAELGERLSNPTNEKPVTEETVRAYVREIRAEIRAEIKRAVDSLRLPDRCEIRIPDLIENVRMLGYRIGACGLEILQPRSSLAPTT